MAVVSALGGVAFVGQAFQSTTAPTQVESARDSSRIILDVTRVNMLFTVSDKKGRFVTDLNKDEIEIFEAKKPRRAKVKSFSSKWAVQSVSASSRRRIRQ